MDLGKRELKRLLLSQPIDDTLFGDSFAFNLSSDAQKLVAQEIGDGDIKEDESMNAFFPKLVKFHKLYPNRSIEHQSELKLMAAKDEPCTTKKEASEQASIFDRTPMKAQESWNPDDDFIDAVLGSQEPRVGDMETDMCKEFHEQFKVLEV